MAIARPASNKRQHVQRVKQLIQSNYPDAKFRVAPGHDAQDITEIWAYTSASYKSVEDLVRDVELAIMDENDVHIITIPQPLELWED